MLFQKGQIPWNKGNKQSQEESRKKKHEYYLKNREISIKRAKEWKFKNIGLYIKIQKIMNLNNAGLYVIYSQCGI
jgi:hypothetical protein